MFFVNVRKFSGKSIQKMGNTALWQALEKFRARLPVIYSDLALPTSLTGPSNPEGKSGESAL